MEMELDLMVGDPEVGEWDPADVVFTPLTDTIVAMRITDPEGTTNPQWDIHAGPTLEGSFPACLEVSGDTERDMDVDAEGEDGEMNAPRW